MQKSEITVAKCIILHGQKMFTKEEKIHPQIPYMIKECIQKKKIVATKNVNKYLMHYKTGDKCIIKELT